MIGSRRATDEHLAAAAEEVGAGLADAGAVVVCGGLGGVMEAVAGAARERGADVIGIVPGSRPGEANPHCTHVVAAATGIARNLAVVASADAGDRDRRRLGDAVGDRTRPPARAAGDRARKLGAGAPAGERRSRCGDRDKRRVIHG